MTKIIRKNTRCFTGSAIIETLVGLFVLLPVFLLLIDVISLVIGQSINDDLAKQAARIEANLPTNDSGEAAVKYVGDTIYAGSTGLVTDASVVLPKFSWTTDSSGHTTVTVVTEVRCNLPAPVPLGGPSYQIFQAQATWPWVGG